MNRLKLSGKGIAAVISLLVLCFLGSAGADSLNVSITTGVSVLNGDSTDARILLGIDLPQELSGTEIVFAELLVPITCTIPDSTALEVYCRPLVISWDPETISWEDLGDSLTTEVIVDEGTIYATAEEGGHEAYFDISEIVKSWKEETIDNNGLLLFCNAELLPRFESNAEESQPLGQVSFTYTH